MNVFESLMGLLVVVFLAFMAYVLFVIMPVAFYTDAQCLREGYPKSEVTIGLERYCMNMTGSVTVKVEHK